MFNKEYVSKTSAAELILNTVLIPLKRTLRFLHLHIRTAILRSSQQKPIHNIRMRITQVYILKTEPVIPRLTLGTGGQRLLLYLLALYQGKRRLIVFVCEEEIAVEVD